MFKFTPTESCTVGIILYIDNHLSNKCRNIYNKNELESTFIKIVNQKILNINVGAIYRHPSTENNTEKIWVHWFYEKQKDTSQRHVK